MKIASPATPSAPAGTGAREWLSRRGPDHLRQPAPRRESRIAILAGAGIALHLLLRFGLAIRGPWMQVPLYVVLVLGGFPLLVDLIRKALAREFGSDLLAGISIAAASAQAEYLVGSIIVLMLSGGTALEHLSSRRASFALDALARRMPSGAHRQTGREIADVKLDDVRVGDTLILYPHEACPADGVVLEGQGCMNEAFLTGEPFEVWKAPGTQVISGALNGASALTIRATRLPVDSRYARIMAVMEETQQRRPRLRRLGDDLGAWYTPLAVGTASLAWVLTGQPHRFLAVLVIATPCPLLLAIPVAVIGAISLAARRAIIIKNPAVLEHVDSCRTFIFDKTGTLTYGRPSLTAIECARGFSEAEVLRAAASVERYSKHPLAQAILDAAVAPGLPLESASEIHEAPGRGLEGVVAGRTVQLVGRGQLPPVLADSWPLEQGLECFVLLDGRFAAVMRFRDVPREGASSFLRHLAPRHKIARLLLLSGDRLAEVQYLASQVGIQEVHAGLSPEEKLAIVRAETKRRKTVFVGDGINDAPAMQAATVGIAFGQNTDVAVEAADAVILNSAIERIDELVHIGRRMRAIALESALGGMGLSMAGMLAAAFGYLPPIAGAVAQEVIDLAAVLNAIRVVLPVSQLKDY